MVTNVKKNKLPVGLIIFGIILSLIAGMVYTTYLLFSQTELGENIRSFVENEEDLKYWNNYSHSEVNLTFVYPPDWQIADNVNAKKDCCLELGLIPKLNKKWDDLLTNADSEKEKNLVLYSQSLIKIKMNKIIQETYNENSIKEYINTEICLSEKLCRLESIKKVEGKLLTSYQIEAIDKDIHTLNSVFVQKISGNNSSEIANYFVNVVLDLSSNNDEGYVNVISENEKLEIYKKVMRFLKFT